MKLWSLATITLVCLSLAACVPRSPIVNSSRSDCVASYDPNRDYFPDKLQPKHAKGFTVSYHKHYKQITVAKPWRDANVKFQYVLVQCGTPIPQGFKPEQVVEVPVRSVVALSTTHLVQLEKIGVIDRLIGVNDMKIVTTQSVLDRHQKSPIAEVGNPANPNVERILDLAPDLVTSYGTGDPKFDGYPKLLEAQQKVAIVSEYMEPTALGQAEWIKFLALFFNREAAANQTFDQVEKRYQQIAAKAKTVKKRPTVFTGFDNKGTWYVPGGDSYVAKLLADAGADYLWRDDRSSGSMTLSFEQVFDRASDAEYWLNGSQKWKSRQDLIQTDSRYQQFTAVKTGNLYSPILRVNAEGGNDYWQSGIANPDLILTDLVKLFHPELLPDAAFTYYKKLP
jgi:iron complex transport system substrate-binding protein